MSHLGLGVHVHFQDPRAFVAAHLHIDQKVVGPGNHFLRESTNPISKALLRRIHESKTGQASKSTEGKKRPTREAGRAPIEMSATEPAVSTLGQQSP